jgi:MFS family permease
MPGWSRERTHFALAAAMFLVVVVNRSSLGVSAPYAEQRLGIGPGQLSAFVMLQIGIYAVLQMPAGVLVDRYGPRRALVAAGVLVASAQLLFGLSRDYPTSLAARVVLGCGDALTFVSVLRVAMSAGEKQHYPALVAVSQLTGFVGNLLATLPLLLLLRAAGWEPTYLGLALATAAVAVAVHLGLRDGWDAIPQAPGGEAGPSRWARNATRAWELPATRVGFWMCFACLTTPMTFLLLWGFPYLTRGAGLGDTTAGSVLLTGVLVSAALMPVSGWVFGRHPSARVPLTLAVAGSGALGWALLLGLGGDSPPAVVVALLVLLSMAGVPACGAAFAIVRDGVDAAVVSTASGIVNAGGYLATALAATAIGLVLQISDAPDPTAFRWALAVMVLIQAAGVGRVLVWQRRAGSTAPDEVVPAGA